MGRLVYIEEEVRDHPRTHSILAKLSGDVKVIACDNYKEVFNPKKQNFRIQKKNPALILAKKSGRRVLRTPEGFGIGGTQNYYFSHMLNCIYDCRYCFLQGMYPSAYHVIFVNYEDFANDISDITHSQQDSTPNYFFSGYDCDSLAFDPVTGFLDHFLPVFAKHPNAILELRTKSTSIRSLQQHDPYDNCVVAFSFTPHAMSQNIEHGVPSVEKRIVAMQKLAQQGWKIGLRFDPMIYASDFEFHYRELIRSIFVRIKESSIHSVSIGPLRFPTKMYNKIVELYPEEPLLSQPLFRRGKQVSYPEEIENNMKTYIINSLKEYISEQLIFECKPI